MRSQARVLLLLCSATACSGLPEPGGNPEVGDAVEIVPLDADFVLVAGERQTLERALFDLRQAIRTADDERRPRPFVRILLAPRLELGDALSRLRDGADLAGVDRIEIEPIDLGPD